MMQLLKTAGLAVWLGVAGIHGAEAADSGGNQSRHDHDHARTGMEEHGEEGHGERSDRETGRAGQAADHQHGHDQNDEEAREIHLSPAQIRSLELRIERLQPRAQGETLHAPGEVRLNAYASSQVASRVEAQITGRHANLGDHVVAGQPLVRLSSIEMAAAQGQLVVAEREWRRVRKLGRKVVSESRYLEAQIGRQQAEARVLAFGMTSDQVDDLLQSGAGKADGSFVLLAPQAGTVIADDFLLGAVIEAGRTLFAITDESVRWVEARMPPVDAARVSIGDPVQVRNGSVSLDGKVIQIHHQLDESTRTQAIRIGLPDPDHRLHPGLFVDVDVYTGAGEEVLSLPEAAVLRGADGDWQVFVAGDEPGSFRPVEVELLYTMDGMAVIDGLSAGIEVVSRGAFFLQSELAKSGFHVHQH